MYNEEEQRIPQASAAGEQEQADLFATGEQGPEEMGIRVPADKAPLIFSDENPLPWRDSAAANPVRKASVLPRKKIHLDSARFGVETLFGDILKQAREQSGLDLEQVTNLTKLQMSYLVALESSELKNLPPMVYVTAYIRTLTELYGLDSESTQLILDKLHDIPTETDVPTTLIQSLERDGMVNEDEHKRIRNMLILVLIVFLLLVTGVIWGICAIVSAVSSSGDGETEKQEWTAEAPAGQPVFTPEEFDSLTTPEVPSASTLKMSKKPGVSR